MNRRDLLLAAAAAALAAPEIARSAGAAAGPRSAAAPALSLADIGEAFAGGHLTSQRLTQMYLERIDTLDRHGPALRAVLETNPLALDIAAELDRERQAHGPRGPLHGVPVLIKDNVETVDRMMTTAG